MYHIRVFSSVLKSKPRNALHPISPNFKRPSSISRSFSSIQSSTPGTLAGIRVIELASVLAGPTVGQFFAELGCEVIKVENPKLNGDVTRGWPDKITDENRDKFSKRANKSSSYFQSCNLGKKSIALDVTDKDSYKKLIKLIEKSDVVITSYKPGDAEKLKLTFDDLQKHNSKLIYARITGYGESSKKTGLDACVQAESGFMHLNGNVKMPVALLDILAAHHLKQGILLGLYERQRATIGNTIENSSSTANNAFNGKEISVSLFGAAAISLANQATQFNIASNVPQSMGSDHPSIAPYGTVFYDRNEKPFVLAAGFDRQFEHLWKFLKAEEGGKDSNVPEKWVTNKQRVADRENLKAFLQEKFSNMDRETFLQKMEDKKIPAGAVADVGEVFDPNSPYSEELSRVMIKGSNLKDIADDGSASSAKYMSQIAWSEDGKVSADLLLEPPGEVGKDTEEVFESILAKTS